MVTHSGGLCMFPLCRASYNNPVAVLYAACSIVSISKWSKNKIQLWVLTYQAVYLMKYINSNGWPPARLFKSLIADCIRFIATEINPVIYSVLIKRCKVFRQEQTFSSPLKRSSQRWSSSSLGSPVYLGLSGSQYSWTRVPLSSYTNLPEKRIFSVFNTDCKGSSRAQ